MRSHGKHKTYWTQNSGAPNGSFPYFLFLYKCPNACIVCCKLTRDEYLAMIAPDITSNLLNIAEISAAFAGFAALVSVLRQRGTRADALHDILRLRIVISTSMVVVVAALIPVGLISFNLSDRLVWGVSAGTLLLLNYGVIYSFIKSYKPVEGKFPPDNFAVGIVSTLEFIDQAALVLVLLNFWPTLNYPLYLAALIFNICQAAFVFVRFVGSEFSVKEV
jgi:hypothetical protein